MNDKTRLLLAGYFIGVSSAIIVPKLIDNLFTNPLNLEKQVQTINLTPNDTLITSNRTKYIVKYDSAGKPNLFPYSEGEK